MRFISPKIDYAFKKIFGSEQSQDILISFLNAIIYKGEKRRQLADLSFKRKRKILPIPMKNYS